VDAIAVPRNKRLDGSGLLLTQRFDQICVAIRAPSRVIERQLSHVTPSSCGMVLPLPRVYRVTVSGSSPAPWKMA